jgi:hypothetical protein
VCGPVQPPPPPVPTPNALNEIKLAPQPSREKKEKEEGGRRTRQAGASQSSLSSAQAPWLVHLEEHPGLWGTGESPAGNRSVPSIWAVLEFQAGDRWGTLQACSDVRLRLCTCVVQRVCLWDPHVGARVKRGVCVRPGPAGEVRALQVDGRVSPHQDGGGVERCAPCLGESYVRGVLHLLCGPVFSVCPWLLLVGRYGVVWCVFACLGLEPLETISSSSLP